MSKKTCGAWNRLISRPLAKLASEGELRNHRLTCKQCKEESKNFKPVPIKGEPLSKTIIRDRGARAVPKEKYKIPEEMKTCSKIGCAGSTVLTLRVETDQGPQHNMFCFGHMREASEMIAILGSSE